jgi:N-methylhydantoinase A/oxoprolinase/acetone carboxylase beta subunit
VHGTTTTTNAMLERKIATVGLITTKGFRDVLELGRRTRPTPYGLKGRFVPLIERHRPPRGRRAHGRRRRVLVPLDEAAVAAGSEEADRARRGERRHPLPAQLHQPGARGARRRDRSRASGRTGT